MFNPSPNRAPGRRPPGNGIFVIIRHSYLLLIYYLYLKMISSALVAARIKRERQIVALHGEDTADVTVNRLLICLGSLTET
jgi:hypothetical protein